MRPAPSIQIARSSVRLLPLLRSAFPIAAPPPNRSLAEFYYTSRPWLWRLLRISRPRGWVGVVHKLGGEQPGIRVSSEGDTFVDSLPASRGVSPTRSGSGALVHDQQQQQQQLPPVMPAGVDGLGLGLPPAAGGLQRLALARTRSQSIERSSAFLSAQLASLETSTSAHSPSSARTSPDSSPDRQREPALATAPLAPTSAAAAASTEFREGPSRRLERSPARASDAGSLRRADSSGSHRLAKSPERIGRSRVRGDILGVGERGMSIDSLTAAEHPLELRAFSSFLSGRAPFSLLTSSHLPVASHPPVVPPIPTTYEPLHVCYPSSPMLQNASDSAFDWPAPPSTVYAPTEPDPDEHPDMAQFLHSLNEAGLPTRLLSFDKFRTTGLQRSLDEGLTGRFVTADRLGLVLKGLGNLEAFGATE